MNYRPLLLFCIFAIYGVLQLYAQAGLPNIKSKIGVQYKFYYLPVITIVSYDTEGGVYTAKKTAPLSGPLVFYERMFTDTFGAGIYGGQMIRQTKVRIDSIDSILSDSTIILGVYAKAYSVKARTNGLKYHLGVRYELVNIDVAFQNTTQNITLNSQSAQISVIGISAGVDYKLKFVALGFELGHSFGEVQTITKTHGYGFGFGTPFVSISIMSLF